MALNRSCKKTSTLTLLVLLSVLILLTNITSADDETDPVLDFVDPTPEDGASQALGIVNINVTIVEENLTSLTYNWDETNYTMYEDSLVLMYNFDNVAILGEDSTTVIDMSSNTNTGSFSVSPDADSGYSISGKYNGAWMFDGGGDYIEVGDVLDFSGNAPFTVSAWFKKESSVPNGDYWAIVNKFTDIKVGENRGNTGWLIGVRQGNKFFFDRWESGTESVSILDETLNNDVWYHVVGTYNGTHIKTYLNGQFGDSSESSFSLSDKEDSLRIGGRSDGWSNAYFDGTIDEVRIWNRCLTDEEIYIHYASNLNKINQTHWNYNITQKKNTTDELDIGTYTYQVFSEDINSNTAQTEQRTIEITGPAPPIPETSTIILLAMGVIITIGLVLNKRRDAI